MPVEIRPLKLAEEVGEVADAFRSQLALHTHIVSSASAAAANPRGLSRPTLMKLISG